MSKSNEDLIRELIESFANLKQKMEDPNYIHLDTSIQQLIQNQEEMKQGMSDLKSRLLNPYDGAIVEIRKNTEFRQEQEHREKEYDKLLEEHKDLVKWKRNFSKAFWVFFTTGAGVIAYILTEIFKK
jgi:predicted RNase H-like nuclease (RuvC/YqgF family)